MNLPSEVKVAQSCPTLCGPMDYIVYGILKARVLEWYPFPSPGDLPNPGIEPRSPSLQVDSLAAEPPGKPKNTGEGSLSLLQRIFPAQDLNWGLLRCRQILYQLSYLCSKISFSGYCSVSLCVTSLPPQFPVPYLPLTPPATMIGFLFPPLYCSYLITVSLL